MEVADAVIYVFQTIGAVLGVLGAFIVTSKNRKVRYVSFWTGAISSIFLMLSYIQLDAWPILAMTAVYLAADVVGIINNRTP